MKKHLLTAVVVAATAAGVLAPAATAGAAPLPTAAAAAHKTANPTPNLHAGSRGAAVARVQRILGVKATGVFNQATVTAVKKFQKAHHLPVVGYVGPRTWKALLATEKAQAAAAARAKAAQVLAAAKGAALLQLDDTDTSVGYARSALTATGTDAVPLSAANQATLLGRLDRIAAAVTADEAAVKAARTPGQATSLGNRATALTDAVDAVNTQTLAASVLSPDLMTSFESGILDKMLAAGKAQGATIDPAKEASLRTTFLDALAKAITAATPLATTELAVDPLAAGAPAQVSALDNQIGKLPEVAAFDQAGNAYEAYVLPGGSTLG